MARKSLPSQQLGNFNAAFLLVIPVVGFQIMDYDKFTSDDLCGNCTLLVDDLQPGGRTFSEAYCESLQGERRRATGANLSAPMENLEDLRADGWHGKVELRRPKSAVGMMMKEDADLPPGIMRLLCTLVWTRDGGHMRTCRVSPAKDRACREGLHCRHLFADSATPR